MWAAVGLSSLMNAFTMTPLTAQAQTGAEAEPVMAAFVHRFTQFVEWPAEALADRDRFGICVAASGTWLETVRSVVDGTEVDGRPIEAREVDPADLDGCQVLFVSAATEGVEAFVEASAGRPILTVSDAPGFLDSEGMIELRIVDRRIRFGVNAGAATDAGLRISSQLLDLALEVRGARP
jgi:hypothetical protein